MLSAFQARKARLQPQHNAPSSPSSSEASLMEVTYSPKRKSTDQDTNVHGSAKKQKKKKKTTGTSKAARYYDKSNVFEAQDNILPIDPDEDISVSELDDEQPSNNAGASARRPPRAWSPSQPFHDSSEDELDEATVQTESHEVRLVSSHQLSCFIPLENVNTFHLSLDEISGTSDGKASAMLIPVSQSIAFVGVYTLTILKGSLTICGAQLGPSMTPYRVFAPLSSPIPVITSIPFDAAQSDDLLHVLPERVKAVIADHHVIILLQELRTGIEGLGRVMRTFERAFDLSAWHTTQSIQNLGIPGVFMCSNQDRDVQLLDLPNDWDAAITSLSRREDASVADHLKPVICLIKGPKNSGKSTFARMLVNGLMTKYKQVAFLECDLGQSEFMPCGFVALNVISEPLLGPPFTHPGIPHASHFIGSSTPRSSPSHYLTAIQALIQTYRLDVQYPPDNRDDGDRRVSDLIPLVVNTMGWVKGLGADLNSKIEELVDPTEILDLGIPSQERYPWTKPAIKSSTWRDCNKRVRSLSSVTPSTLSARYTPAELRGLSTLSYFHAKSLLFETEQIYPQWETSLPLCARPPYEVDIKAAFDQIVLLVGGMEDIIEPEILRVLNGAIVALVKDQNRLSNDATEVLPSANIPYTRGSVPPSPLDSNCIGLGLIRSLSSTRMHIITPIPLHLIARCRVLVKGEVELPVWGMLDFRSENDEYVAGVERSKVPYLRWGKGEELGGEKRRIRRNLMRKGQL